MGHFALCYYYYFGYRDYDHALRELALAEVGLPNDPGILLTKAFIWRRQGKFEAAVEQMRQVFVLNPRGGALAFMIAETYEISRDYALAEKFFSQAISLAPDEIAAYLFKAANYCLWRGDTMLARATLTSIPEQNDDRTRLGWFWLYLNERNYGAAIGPLALMSRVPEPDQTRFVPKVQLAAIIYDLMNDPERARACFDSARVILENELTVRSGDHRVHSSLGIVYAGLGRKDDAIREGKLGVELFPVSKDAYIGPCRVENLAQIYVMVGEYDSALDQIEYLLSIPSWFSVPLLRLDPRYDPLRTLPRYQKLLEKYAT
jgi:tetratricopeptide (TPR) repeat protein